MLAIAQLIGLSTTVPFDEDLWAGARQRFNCISRSMRLYQVIQYHQHNPRHNWREGVGKRTRLFTCRLSNWRKRSTEYLGSWWVSSVIRCPAGISQYFHITVSYHLYCSWLTDSRYILSLWSRPALRSSITLENRPRLNIQKTGCNPIRWHHQNRQSGFK